MSNTNIKTKNLVVSAMFAAVIAVCSQIAFVTPTGVPFTLQTFAVCLCGYTKLPQLYVYMLHERYDSLADRSEIMVIQLLSFRRHCTKQGTAGKDQVFSL